MCIRDRCSAAHVGPMLPGVFVCELPPWQLSGGSKPSKRLCRIFFFFSRMSCGIVRADWDANNSGGSWSA
ncbi:hypothetical protein VFPFJ_02272 [Purpureocillium lilacinum]|uniref:Uncharacterized protein n=1 Tax=Purpureocillium lilacinum TaxID=33203 RepID=A0A179HU63_PURLI|nr:hypothetical protein VFPFJ_02272 [Purpureocillium lilacinum]OAQ93111.1 hypothetical protein VFPFJ_02272 [Purpureocillium lilacinum]